MVDVVSFGSINVDRTSYLDAEKIANFEEKYDWFPQAGATVEIPSPPDEILELTFENFLGGKAANQAVAAARAEGTTKLLGKVGHDASEYAVKEKLRQRGVHVDQIEPSREPTGKAYIFVNETGESHIGLVPGANDDVNEIYVDDHFDSVLNATCLLLQNEIPTETTEYLLSKLEKHPNDRPTVILDPSPIHGAERLLDHDVVDIVSPNDFEFSSLSDYFSNIQTIIHRQGPDDVIVTTQDEQFRVTPPTVDAIDATGAGDVFNGYLGASLATGADIRDAIELATYAASISTEIAGAQQSIPTLDEVTSAQSRFEDQD